MIRRIVKMEFDTAFVLTFEELFQRNKSRISGFPGCNHLELWNDIQHPNVFFTFSIWEGEADLENYRQSEIFKGIWKETKKGFSEKPQAWSVELK